MSTVHVIEPEGVSSVDPRHSSPKDPEAPTPYGPTYYSRQEERWTRGDNTVCQANTCISCGRKVGGRRYAYVRDGGSSFGEYRADGHNHDDIGFEPVGNKCAQALKGAGVPTYTLNYLRKLGFFGGAR